MIRRTISTSYYKLTTQYKSPDERERRRIQSMIALYSMARFNGALRSVSTSGDGYSRSLSRREEQQCRDPRRSLYR